MSEVKRFIDVSDCMEEFSEGPWVDYEDYAELKAQRDALEQRAEAAEHERDCHMDIAEHFKARCKEMEQQKPYGYVHNLVDPPGGGVAASIFKEDSRHYGRPLFTRPAPAINLAELVPDECIPAHYTFSGQQEGEEHPRYAEGFNACRSAILRKIEEAK